MKLRIVLFALATTLVGVWACSGEREGGREANEDLSPKERQAYLQKGKSIAQATFAELSGQLSEALAEGGVENALQYCNLVAYPLVDSLSKVHHADIRRTSLKVRNPKDRPTERERKVLNAYHEAVKQGRELKPQVQRINDQQIAFYAPITIKALCLKCHGEVGEDIRESDYATIQALYPEDEATGYAMGDLRGMWSITLAPQRSAIKD